MTKSPFEMFATDKTLETRGIRVDYGAFYFNIARAGGANDRFRDLVREKTRPYQRAIDLGQMDEDVALKLSGEAFAESVLMGWGKVVEGKDVPNKMPSPKGDIDFNVANAIKLFAELPELLADLMFEAQKRGNFQRVENKDDAKN
jgi:hypothetical protein